MSLVRAGWRVILGIAAWGCCRQAPRTMSMILVRTMRVCVRLGGRGTGGRGALGFWEDEGCGFDYAVLFCFVWASAFWMCMGGGGGDGLCRL